MAWHDVVGMAGVACVLAAYGLLQTGRMHSTQVSFSALNALGAGLILVSLLHEFNLSAFVIEAVWLVISLYGMFANRGRPAA